MQVQKKVFILASFPPSIINFRLELLKSLQKKNFEINVCAPFLKSDKSIISKLENEGFKCYKVYLKRYSTNIFKEILYLFSLLKVLIKVRPDIFISYTIKPVLIGTFLAIILNVKKRIILITGLGYVFTGKKSLKGKILRKIIIWFFKFILSKTSNVFFQNNHDQKLFKKLKILDDQTKSSVLNGSGVNIDYYKKVKFSNSPITFLLISRLLKSKGIQEYAEAAKNLKKQFKSLKFILVGGFEKSEDSILEEDLKSWQDEGVLTWIDNVKDVRPYIKKSHVYVLPSYREGTPRSVLEAMSMGRPIITTNVPGCKQLIFKNKNGFLVQPRSSKSIENAMKKFINNRALIEKMGYESYRIAKNKYDVRKVNDNFIKEINL